MIKGKTPEEIRKTFNIKNDFTEEEEAQVIRPSVVLRMPPKWRSILYQWFPNFL